MALSGTSYGITTWKGIDSGLSHLSLLRISASDSHVDLLAFLATAQVNQTDFLPIMWYPSYYLGRGGFAVLNQSPVKAELHFAFKRLGKHTKAQDEEMEDFSSSISELAILRHDPIASHPNITKLEVFEKAAYGNLFHFRDTEEGKKLTIVQKISLCAQILDALYTLHASRIIHGDIKPFNILVFKNVNEVFVVKLADPGHSVIFRDKSDMFRLPSSEPWTAPEWHHRHHSFAQARNMDIYSFALVCLWLFMSDPFYLIDSKAALLAIQDYKKSGSLVHEACNLVDSLDAATSIKQGLKSLFKMTLTRESRKIIRSIATLIPHLDPDRQIQWVKVNGAKSNHETYHVDFSISHNLYKAKFSPCTTCKKNAAVQLAFCYNVGFGIRSDHEMAQYWVDKSERELEDLEEEKDEVADFLFYNNKRVRELDFEGFTMVMDHVNQYRRADYDLTIVTNAYRGEIVDLDGTHGAKHSSTLGSRIKMGHILQEQGRMKEAGQTFREVLATRTDLLGSEHPETLESGTALASLLFWTNELHEARELLESIMEARERLLGAEHLDTLLTITNIACVYREQGLYSRAQQLDEQVWAVKKRVLGDEAHETINSMANLALSFTSQGVYGRAEKLELEVLDKRKRFLGESNPATLVAKTNLAVTYYHQARLDEAEKLELEVFQGRQHVFGKSHWLTLFSMSNLLNTYIEQGRMEICEQSLTLLLQASLAAPEPNARLRSSILANAKRMCSLYKECGRLESLTELEEKMDLLQ
ncbi:MAG: hypothetical protein Q9161_000797 [Pseudevernia consocians]